MTTPPDRHHPSTGLLPLSLRRRRNRRAPKWHVVYSLLALFDVLVVGTGLVYVHRIVQSYHGSVVTTRAWAERIGQVSLLNDAASRLSTSLDTALDLILPIFDMNRLIEMWAGGSYKDLKFFCLVNYGKRV